MQNKEAMQAFVTDLLKKNIPPSSTYHDLGHTLYVQNKAREIGLHEKLDTHEMDLLNTAALWHDTGYIHTYKDHEEESCRMAKMHLPIYGYKENDIDRICGMIMATKIPQTAHNRLEEILADADLAYLGTIGAAEKAENLFKELRSVNPGLTQDDWKKQQVSFLETHSYFTSYYREKKEPAKQTYLEQLKK